MTIRDTLTEQLTAKLPTGWRLIPYDDSVDELDAVTVMFRQQSVEPTKEAMQGCLTYGYQLVLLDPATDPAVLEPALDAEVEDLVDVVMQLSWMSLQQGKKATVLNRLAYVLDVDVLAVPDKVTAILAAQKSTTAAPRKKKTTAKASAEAATKEGSK
jgi:hypothetical protein